MPRTGRSVSATKMYHVMIRGNNKETVFKTHRDKRKFMRIIEESEIRTGEKVEVYAYCIMLNHAHFLLRGDLEYVSQFMKEIETTYALYYNFNRDRVGHVFQGRYKSEPVEDEIYFWTCFLYIHDNPVKAGIAVQKEEYPYSSKLEYINQQCDIIHRRAMLMYNKKFGIMSRNKTLAERRKYAIIMDLEEDMKIQKVEVVKYYIRVFIKMQNIESGHMLIHTPALRKEFIEFVNSKVEISKNEIIRILKEL